MPETITVEVESEHVDPLRRQIASKCGTAAERLHTAADNYAFLMADPSAAQTAIEEVGFSTSSAGTQRTT